MILLTTAQGSSGKQHIDNLYWTSMGIWAGVIVKLYHLVLFGKFVAGIPPQLVFIWVLGTVEMFVFVKSISFFLLSFFNNIFTLLLAYTY